jgi:hypothetical protein
MSIKGVVEALIVVSEGRYRDIPKFRAKKNLSKSALKKWGDNRLEAR